ncbi:MAG: response regulator [Deltaproteobacteria bacterium]|nr:response regulator [Deltaproteobacteria bacterium]
MGKNVLLVDDDPVIRMLVGDCLSAVGHVVDQASGGNECLEKLTLSTPQVIILDLIMPDLNGLDVLQSIKSDVIKRSIPVILLSADPDIQLTASRRNLNADLYLQKPFDIQTIIDAVNRL